MLADDIVNRIEAIERDITSRVYAQTVSERFLLGSLSAMAKVREAIREALDAEEDRQMGEGNGH